MIAVGSVTGEIGTAYLNKRWGIRSFAGVFVPISLVTALMVFLFLLGVEGAFGDAVPVPAWPRLFMMVWVIAAAMTSVGWMMDRVLNPPEAAMVALSPSGASTPPAEERIRAFLRRLPGRFTGARLLAVSSEDHYLRVHTDRGSELILMRLSDAVAELDGAGGMQVHRSWWVMNTAVEGTRGKDGKLELLLPGGIMVPGARSRMEEVRRAGLA